MNNNIKLKFKVHHESTDKNDSYTFLFTSLHQNKEGIIIGFFYSGVLGICTTKFLNDQNSFTQLLYLKSLLQNAKIEALKISKHNCSTEIPNHIFFKL